MQGFTSLSINLDKSKTDLETAKGTNTICAGHSICIAMFDSGSILDQKVKSR
jgi:hypothetical protein